MYIDSGLSEEGRQQCTKATLPEQYLTGSRNIDLVFVSPMNRTLQTADLLIKANHLKVKRVVVLPELS